MYAWLFRSLPGPLWVRIGITLVLLAGVFLLLMEVVFPWANQFNPLNESTMDLESAGLPGTEQLTSDELTTAQPATDQPVIDCSASTHPAHVHAAPRQEH